LSVKLDELFDLLGDSRWHELSRITTALQIPENKLNQIVNFLAEANLIQHHPQTNQIKLDQNWKALLINSRETDTETLTNLRKTAFGTIIIPSQQTLMIQSTCITNLTDTSLELGIRTDGKLNEIVIDKVK